ncbi:MAG: VWA domain-containing protein [Bacteroidota bacterium]
MSIFTEMDEKLKKWRLILGSKADPQGETGLEGDSMQMDKVLDALYDSERKGGLGSSAPNVNRWLGDIRKYFPSKVVQVMQRDAFDRLGLQQMLLEPELLESVEADVSLVATILSLNKIIPNKTKDTARKVVRKVVEELQKKLHNPMRQAIKGSLSRSIRNRRPRLNEIDWHQTIRANLKHYQHELGAIIPERLIGYGRKGQSLRHVILLVDQSGSMGTSVVYSGIFGAIMASLSSVKTHMVVFDTSVVDLTEQLNDPVDLLFGTQLGGGTDINKALAYTEGLITRPEDTILVLISDLYEGGNARQMVRRIASIKGSGVQFITLLALSDKGAPSYDHQMAAQLASLDIPSFACTPELFPDLMAAAIKKEDISQWKGRNLGA